MNDLLELLRIGPDDVYEFSEDDLILVKLQYGLDIKMMNGTNPFQSHNPYYTETTICLINILLYVMTEEGSKIVGEFLDEMCNEYIKEKNLDDYVFRCIEGLLGFF